MSRSLSSPESVDDHGKLALLDRLARTPLYDQGRGLGATGNKWKFVKQLFSNTRDRAPTRTELKRHVEELRGGLTRLDLAGQIIFDAKGESYQSLHRRVDIQLLDEDELKVTNRSWVEWAHKGSPFAGIRYKRGRFYQENGGSSAVHLSTANLNTEGVRVEVSRPTTSLRTTGAWAAANGLEVATNGDFFGTVGGRTVSYGEWMGGGNRSSYGLPSTHWAHRNYASLSFGSYGVDFTHSRFVKRNRDTLIAQGYTVGDGYSPRKVAPAELPAGARHVISGFPELVIEGKAAVCQRKLSSNGWCFPDRKDTDDLNPRTAIGINENGNRVHLLTVTGRGLEGNSAGARGAELAQLMAAIGSYQAINLDGGGSTTHWHRNQGSTSGRVINAPSGGSQRAVLSKIGFHSDGPQ